MSPIEHSTPPLSSPYKGEETCEMAFRKKDGAPLTEYLKKPFLNERDYSLVVKIPLPFLSNPFYGILYEFITMSV